ncbi:MAG TPA: type 4a pilus biogenesis protein PilO [Bacteriovoracaceae bacterium]|nr:type 4a pilus biogenesis protein PilO [Bacteriovoracaceae bacterium]
MKDLVNKFIANLHVFLALYGMYGLYVLYDEHLIAVEVIQTQFPQVEAEIVTTQKKIKEIADYIKKTDEYKARVEGVAKNIEEVQKQLPHEINDTHILSFLNTEMTALNIKDPNLVPGKEEPSTYFISKEYTLKAKGTFLQFLILLERIGNATRIYNVKSLKLIVNTEGKKGRFQIVSGEGTIQAFRYNPDFKVDRGFDKIESMK